ncbi:MmgE/PrpD family protein [Mesorhizobium sp. B2-6-5]|uniref:MmgE/PrpD family protein n=1 Tax=Mesorhizobium sp. B2-6-5 TaxID=2589912 RepID=UPI001FEF6314|nr:MmgE/PrpD family protein [Mesorhizobium sp. B2-6-5]
MNDGQAVLHRNATHFITDLRYEDIPDDVVARIKDHLLDTIGIAIVASRAVASRIARDTAFGLFGAGAAAPSARMLFDGRRCSVAGAAFAGAMQIDSYDCHDGYPPSKGHIGVVALPSLSAFAQGIEGHNGGKLSGRDALAALVMLYEVAGRCGSSLHASVPEHHVSGAWNAIGVAALGARLLGLDHERLRHALGIAEFHGPRGLVMRVIANPTMLNDGSGWGCMSGITAAYLAQQGFTGAPATTLEVRDAASHWADLSSRWLLREQYIKPYPVCRWAHPLIDAALRIGSENAFTPEDITAIEIATFATSAALYRGMPQNTSMAQLSLSFPVAAALARGRVGPDEVLGSGLNDPKLQRLVGLTGIRADETYCALYPKQQCGDVTVVLSDGRRITSGPSRARGGPDAPLSEAELVTKFSSHANDLLGVERATAIRQAVQDLDRPDARFDNLQQLLLAPIPPV